MKIIKILNCRVWNIIYTEGVLKGFVIKQLSILLVITPLSKLRRIRIPLWIMGYDRKHAEWVRKVSEEIRRAEREERGGRYETQ